MTRATTLRQRLTATLAALAIAAGGLAASATPARAIDRDDLFRLLLTAATIAVIVRAYNDRERRSDRRYDGRVLPDDCIETMRTGGRNIDVYNSRCLRDYGMRNLPERCERTIRTDRGSRRVFSANCLFDAGYRAEGWRFEPPRASLLPARCALTYRQGERRIAGYYGECLERAGFRNLPQRCALTARSDGRRITIYNTRCLEDAGYLSEAFGRR